MAKKNYRPSMAARKKVEEQRLAEKLAKRRSFLEKNKKQLIIGAVALVAAIVIICIAWDFFYVPSGALRTFMGKVQGVEPNSLVRKIDGQYYELARMDVPAGYETAEYSAQLAQDPQEQNLYFENTAEGAVIDNVYVAAVANRTGSDMVNMLVNSGLYEVANAGNDVQMGEHTVNYLYCQNPSVPEDATNEDYYAMLVVYVDNGNGSSVMINATSSVALQPDLPTEEIMVAEVEPLLAALTLTK